VQPFAPAPTSDRVLRAVEAPMRFPWPCRTAHSALGAGLRPRRARLRIESLEDRTLPSTIVWANRGGAASDTDNLNAVFGANAATARAVVDAAIQAWETVIVSFNFADGSNAFQLTVLADPTHKGNGALAWSGLQNDGQGRPTSGKIELQSGSDGHGGSYYLDPNVWSPAFGGNLVTPYARDATPGGSAAYLGDLFTLMTHELTHVLGINSDPAEAFQSNAHGYLRNTGQADAEDQPGTLFVFDGPSIKALLTSDDEMIGGVVQAEHVAKPGNSYTDPQTHLTYSGSVDALNPTYAFGRRCLISPTDALILRDAYGYTVALPPGYGNGWVAVPTQAIATGSGAGGAPQVQVFDGASGAWLFSFYAYDPAFTGGVRVAVGDVNGDGTPDLVTAPGPGGVPLVRVFDGRNGTLLREFNAYATSFHGGVSVAVGDVDHDGLADVVTGALAGNPDVRVYGGKQLVGNVSPAGSLLAQWFAYGLNFNVGANVAVGDVNRDGYADVVTGATAGNPHVRVFNGKVVAQGDFHPSGAGELGEWFPYALAFNVGANVSVGDVDGDGFADVITGATSGNPDVRVYRGRDVAAGLCQGDAPAGCVVVQFFAYALQSNLGVNVATADVDGDGFADIITGTTAGSPQIKVYKGKTMAGGGNFLNSDVGLWEQFFASDPHGSFGVTVGAEG
jgi:hypothetical protein